MIRINLLPGSDKRKKRATGFSLKLPGSMPAFDRMTGFIVAAWIIGPLVGLWLFFGLQSEQRDVQVALDQAVADSTRYARLIATQASLRARQDTIAQKLAVIQEIDQGRYIWPHVMDEIGRVVPPYTWLTAIYQLRGGANPQFQIEGRTGSLPALTRFMESLEASPFIRGVQLISTEQGQLGNNANQVVNNFVLTGTYETPSVELIETVPLFEGMTAADTITDAEASNGAGTS